MTEILTESFCERCGTRYTFESVAPRQRRLGGLKVLGLGLKHFVLSDDSSLDESIAAARSDMDRDATNHQLDAFHRTFSFCMSCRQYTCANCWNEAEARCLSCSPQAIAESDPIPDVQLDPGRLLRFLGGPPEHENAHEFETNAQLSSALPDPARTEPESNVTGRHSTDPSIEAAPERAAPAAAAETDAEAAPATAAEAPYFGDGPARNLDGLADGQSLNDALAAFEAALDVEAPTALGAEAPGAELIEPVLVADVRLAAMDVASVGAATVDVTPVGELERAPVAEPHSPDAPLEPQPIAAAADSVVQPVWRVPAEPAASPPQWPTGPRWPTGVPARTIAAQEAVPVDALAALMARTSTDAMWAASSREILLPAAMVPSVAAVQSCGNCGISLSAHARFCRRCGTPQG